MPGAYKVLWNIRMLAELLPLRNVVLLNSKSCSQIPALLWPECLCASLNASVEILMPKVMVLGGKTFGK